jgi:hypothetical protein
MTAMTVDQATDQWRHETRHEQREREAAHHEGYRPAAVRSDQRQGQDRRIEDRAPGQDLRDAEHRHGTPGAEDEVADGRHGIDARPRDVPKRSAQPSTTQSIPPGDLICNAQR